MSTAHIVEVPKVFFGLKIAQVVLSVLILGLSAFVEYAIPNSGSAFAIFCCIWTFIVNAYYLVSTSAAKGAYNWIALLVLECFAVVFWLSTWATLAADYVIFKGLVCIYDGCEAFDEAEKLYPMFAAGTAVWQATIVFGVVQFVLFCVTLFFFGMAVHRHRIAGKPMVAGGSFGSNNAWSAAEKNEMNNMRAGQGQTYQPTPEFVPSPQAQQNQAPYGGQQNQYQGYGGNHY